VWAVVPEGEDSSLKASTSSAAGQPSKEVVSPGAFVVFLMRTAAHESADAIDTLSKSLIQSD